VPTAGLLSARRAVSLALVAAPSDPRGWVVGWTVKVPTKGRRVGAYTLHPGTRDLLQVLCLRCDMFFHLCNDPVKACRAVDT